MKIPPGMFPWKLAGLCILVSLIFLILLFHFPGAAPWIIPAGVLIVLGLQMYLRFRLNQIVAHSQKLFDGIARDIGETDEQIHKSAQPSSRKKSRFNLWVTTFAICLFLGVLHGLLKENGTLTHRKDLLLLAIASFVASLFCGINLFWSVGERRTWLRGLNEIARDESPWNYWVAIFIWVLLTAGFFAGFVLKIRELR